MEHFGGDRTVGRDEHEHGRKVGVDHTRTLCDTAHGTGLTTNLKSNGDLFFHGVRGHDALCRVGAIITKTCDERVKSVCDGGDVERLSDNACGSHNDVGSVDTELFGNECARFFRNLDAVCVAGVGVAAIADDCLRLAVCKMRLGYGERSGFDEVFGIDRCRICHRFAVNQRNVFFGFIFTDSAMNPVCLESFCGANAARYCFHNSVLNLSNTIYGKI